MFPRFDFAVLAQGLASFALQIKQPHIRKGSQMYPSGFRRTQEPFLILSRTLPFVTFIGIQTWT